MSQELQNLLSGARPAGLYRLTSRAGSASIASKAEQRGWRFFRLDGRQVASKSDFLQACAEALGFPSYFGHNWDALEDSLRDLSWAPRNTGICYSSTTPGTCGRSAWRFPRRARDHAYGHRLLAQHAHTNGGPAAWGRAQGARRAKAGVTK